MSYCSLKIKIFGLAQILKVNLGLLEHFLHL